MEVAAKTRTVEGGVEGGAAGHCAGVEGEGGGAGSLVRVECFVRAERRCSGLGWVGCGGWSEVGEGGVEGGVWIEGGLGVRLRW